MEVTFGLRCVEKNFRLHFIPIVTEQFDQLLWHIKRYDPPLQRLLKFCECAKALGGCDVCAFLQVYFNVVR